MLILPALVDTDLSDYISFKGLWADRQLCRHSRL